MFYSNKMDFEQLKKMAKKWGGILVLNGNEPEFVILPYNQYKKAESEENGAESGYEKQGDEKTIEKLNQEISALKEEIRQKESAELIESESGGDEEPIADPVLFE